MRDYRRLAKFLDGLRKGDDARVFYDLFADALVWSDEVPPAGSPDRESFDAAELRGLWRYRTTLILGQPEERRRAAWEEAQRCFPNWPGFDPTRRDNSLAAIFIGMAKEATNKWEVSEDLVETELARKNVNV